MPSSAPGNIETFSTLVKQLKPKKFLDIGIGFGKWGFLTREYSDVKNRCWKKQDWEVQIDGVEIYEPYILDHQKFIYNTIYNESIVDIAPKLTNYDMVMAADVIEHINKPDAEKVLKTLCDKAQTTIVSIPIGGDEWLVDSNKEYTKINPFEKHLSTWDVKTFRKLGFQYFNLKFAPGTRLFIGFFVKTSEKINVQDLIPLTVINEKRIVLSLRISGLIRKVFKRMKNLFR